MSAHNIFSLSQKKTGKKKHALGTIGFHSMIRASVQNKTSFIPATKNTFFGFTCYGFSVLAQERGTSLIFCWEQIRRANFPLVKHCLMSRPKKKCLVYCYKWILNFFQKRKMRSYSWWAQTSLKGNWAPRQGGETVAGCNMRNCTKRNWDELQMIYHRKWDAGDALYRLPQ